MSKNQSNRNRIAIGASGILGDRVLEYLALRTDIEIVGVDTKTDREGQTDCLETIKRLSLPLASYNEIVALKPNIFLSISYLRKIKNDLLDSCLCVNLHNAKLPEYRGRNMFAHAIQNEEEFYYCTLHLMTDGFDEGDIIAERKEEIKFDDTSKTLYDRIQDLAYEMFIQEFNSILDGTFKTRPQVGTPHYFSKELNKEVSLKLNPLQFYNRVRSLDFPPYSPAYIIICGCKEELRLSDIHYNKIDKAVYVPRLLFGFK
ncbi:hypothetical protein M0R04_12790 [Candidatus Dojkabacteria bacterium]|jgi:methionyl-tRNA formyltransferase|nr:hypothetical protein [Candidatus Dojkabacteria bacterium]